MRRIAVLVVAGAVTVGALSGCGADQNRASTTSSSSPTSGLAAPARVPIGLEVRTLSVKVRGGKASGDIGQITVPWGTPVVLSVSSDVTDQIYVHGYDRKAKVPARTTAAVTFTADTPGLFEVELENSKLRLLQLRVS